MAETDPAGGPTTQLRRWGPLGVLVVIVLVVVGVVVFSGGDDDGETNAAGDTAGDTGGGGGDSDVPDEVISFTRAEDEGLDVDFGDTCDTGTGRYKIPWFFAPECFAPFDGDNGGATDIGVTEDSIKVVLYLAQDEDPILNFITDAISNDDDNTDSEATVRGLIEYYETFYETYGRRVDLEVVVASGFIDDEVAARADAVRIAEDIKPFAVWNGPLLTSAFGEELAARDILCISCVPAQEAEWYADRDPYVWGLGKNSSQVQTHVAEYITKKVAGLPAEHAGDPAMRDTERVFGYLYLESSDNSKQQADAFIATLAEDDVEVAEVQAYTLDPARLQEQAASVITKLKDAGVTSLIFNGDPIAPRTFTAEATAQGWRPEWILTGSALVDTTVFARTYDQEQWAHAFGVSNLSARTVPENGGAFRIYEWFHGEEPPAPDTIEVLNPQPALFYAVLQGAGARLTHEDWRDALFRAAPTTRAITSPSLSYGDKDIWPFIDYLGVDDTTEVWWDAEIVGPDEIRDEGPGMYQYVDGGTRYLPGEWPDGPTKAFDPDGAVAVYEEPPPEEAVEDYPRPA